ncbi:MAG: HAMP domain-containing sensor histidine kinase [bacterium]
MNKIIEQIISYFLGIFLGGIFGVMVLSLHLSYIQKENPVAIIAITSLLGLVTYTAIAESEKTKIMRRNNAVRNEAIALITHEMRTGLTSTGWAIQLILQKYSNVIDQSDKSNLEAVLESIHTTILHSVNLLDISVLDLSNLSISLEWVSLEKIEQTLAAILKEFAMGAQKKGIEFVSNLKLDKNKQAEVDMLRLRIILGNLLENAIQYTINEKRLINVDISNTDTSLNITVKDSGIGIPQKEQDKIFEEFYRGSNARAKLPTGSGIGLYACSQYVKAHKGTIRFESKEGIGSTFYVTIPLKTKEDIDEFMKKI